MTNHLAEIDEIDSLRPGPVDEQVSYLAKAADSQIVELVVDLEEQLRDQDRRHAERTATARLIVEAGYKEVGARIIVELIPPKTKLDKRPSDLAKLFAVLPADELDGALWRDAPPKPEDMPLESNGTKLKALAKKYGPSSEVARIIARGLVPVDIGSPKVRIERRAKDVTPEPADG
jgi:hypothetical protein